MHNKFLEVTNTIVFLPILRMLRNMLLSSKTCKANSTQHAILLFRIGRYGMIYFSVAGLVMPPKWIRDALRDEKKKKTDRRVPRILVSVVVYWILWNRQRLKPQRRSKAIFFFFTFFNPFIDWCQNTQKASQHWFAKHRASSLSHCHQEPVKRAIDRPSHRLSTRLVPVELISPQAPEEPGRAANLSATDLWRLWRNSCPVLDERTNEWKKACWCKESSVSISWELEKSSWRARSSFQWPSLTYTLDKVIVAIISSREDHG